jgi:hypothetical protein
MMARGRRCSLVVSVIIFHPKRSFDQLIHLFQSLRDLQLSLETIEEIARRYTEFSIIYKIDTLPIMGWIDDCKGKKSKI